MSAVILRPHAVLDPLEAMRLRGNFDLVAQSSRARVIVDLTGTSHLSAAGLAAVTNIVMRARRGGMPIRVLLPARGSDAGRVIDHADLWRFLESTADNVCTHPGRRSPFRRPVERALTPA